jgi:hypothetical protein
MTEPFLTKRELAAHLGVSPRTVQRLALPHTRVGGQNRYLLSQCLAALNGVPESGGNLVRFPIERTRRTAA